MPEIGDTQPAAGEPAPSGEPAAPAPPPAADPPKTFTQEDLDKLAGRRAAEAKRAAVKEIAETLGVSVDDAKKIIEEKRQADEAAKTELEKAQEAVAAAQRERDEAMAEAAQRTFAAKLQTKLTAAGVGAVLDPSKEEQRKQGERNMARALKLLESLPADASDEDVDAEIAQLVADVPGLVTKATANGAPSGVTNGAQPPAGGQGTVSAMEKGRQRARAHKPDDNKNDPFTGPAFRRVG